MQGRIQDQPQEGQPGKIGAGGRLNGVCRQCTVTGQGRILELRTAQHGHDRKRNNRHPNAELACIRFYSESADEQQELSRRAATTGTE